MPEYEEPQDWELVEEPPTEPEPPPFLTTVTEVSNEPQVTLVDSSVPSSMDDLIAGFDDQDAPGLGELDTPEKLAHSAYSVTRWAYYPEANGFPKWADLPPATREMYIATATKIFNSPPSTFEMVCATQLAGNQNAIDAVAHAQETQEVVNER